MVKKLLGRLGGAAPAPQDEPATEAADDSGFFTTQFLERDETPTRRVTWREREAEVQAKRMTAAEGTQALQSAWAGERRGPAFGAGHGLDGLARYLSFVRVAPDREVIAQDEHGDYMLIVLEGTVAVDRVQPWGGRARLSEAQAGDLLGEMSLLDAGTRFSACRTLAPCALAVLEAASLDRMLREDPRMAAAVMTTLARRLSLRLRQSGARLSALLAQG
jgi:CRP/FNR family transcriptional regulator, cyclic AMP receptor protein